MYKERGLAKDISSSALECEFHRRYDQQFWLVDVNHYGRKHNKKFYLYADKTNGLLQRRRYSVYISDDGRSSEKVIDNERYLTKRGALSAARERLIGKMQAKGEL